MAMLRRAPPVHKRVKLLFELSDESDRSRMSSAQYIPNTILNARDAIASLVRWKITLQTATQMREPLSKLATRTIQHPDECSVGLWLLSRHTLHLRHMPEYRAVVNRHTQFHQEMQTVARLINTGEYAAADRMLNAPTGFQYLCNVSGHAIMALERVSAGKIAF
jgi:hypothetical protein